VIIHLLRCFKHLHLSRVAQAMELVDLLYGATPSSAVVNEESRNATILSEQFFSYLKNIFVDFISLTPFSFFFSRMEAVFAWCKGVKFIEVQKLTGSFEGTTIRTLRRLEELVRQITNAAKAIGDKDLEAKFEEGSKLIKRDIVFCSSLYL
jgi:superfamily II RNA helicase